jgi:hypothetical protein
LELTGYEGSSGSNRRARFKEAVKSFARKTPAYLPAKSLASKVASVTKLLRTPPLPTSPTKTSSALITRGFFAGSSAAKIHCPFRPKKKLEEFAPLLCSCDNYASWSCVVLHCHESRGVKYIWYCRHGCTTSYCFSLLLLDSHCGLFKFDGTDIIPSLAEKKPSLGRAYALRNTMQNLFKAGGVFGGIMVAAVTCIPFITRFFTTDHAVMTLVKSVIPMLVGFFCVHGVCMASEGILLGQKDLNFVGSMYGSFFFAVPFFMLRVKKAGIAGLPGISLTTVWTIFVFYQAVRVSSFVARCNLVQQRSDRAGAAGEYPFEL